MNPAGPAPPLRVVIADDEGPARSYLSGLIEKEPALSLVAECAGGREAVEAVRRCRPDLLFLDVQMPEVDGFDVIAELGGEVPAQVIFVTAHDAHAVRAFEVHALDYLLKPFGRERFRKAVERALAAEAGQDALAPAPLAALLSGAGFPKRMLIKSGGRIHIRAVAELDWAEAEGNYVRLHFGADSFVQREKITDLEAQLDPTRFARPHRSMLVNLDRVRELRPVFHGDYVVVLRNGREITLGRPYRERFLAQMRGGSAGLSPAER